MLTTGRQKHSLFSVEYSLEGFAMPLPLLRWCLHLFFQFLSLPSILCLLLRLLDLLGLWLDPEDLPDRLFFHLVDDVSELFLLLVLLDRLGLALFVVCSLLGNCLFFTVLFLLLRRLFLHLRPLLAFEVVLLLGNHFLSSLLGLEDSDFVLIFVLNLHCFSLAYLRDLIGSQWSSVFGLKNVLFPSTFHLI
jgi:hypothetical protein